MEHPIIAILTATSTVILIYIFIKYYFYFIKINKNPKEIKKSDQTILFGVGSILIMIGLALSYLLVHYKVNLTSLRHFISAFIWIIGILVSLWLGFKSIKLSLNGYNKSK